MGDKTKHTPGPWIYTFTGVVYDTKETFIANFNREANGKLMAAAPDLLEACRFVVKALDRLGTEREMLTLQVVNKAIAKAEGK